MSKAEDKALEAYPIVISQHSDNCKEYDSNESDRLVFIEGYHQAEKDNELTWEDVEIILNAFLDLCIENNEQRKTKRYTDKEYCQEVLKRFFKERKKK